MPPTTEPSSIPKTSSSNKSPIFLIFSGKSCSTQETTRIYRSQRQAIQWCKQRVQIPRIKSWTKYNVLNDDEHLIDSNSQTVEIVGPSKGLGVEMVYTVERCHPEEEVSQALRAYFARGKTSMKELWAVYDTTYMKVWGICVDEKDAEEIQESEDPRMLHDLTIRRVPFVDEDDG
ncbi:MAG: hypothetical protein Q9199_002987 [Rusavskia elegans]